MTDGLRRGKRVITAPVPELLLFDPSISSHAKVIWGLLDRRIDNRPDSDTNGCAFPGREWLTERMNVSVSTVDRAIAELRRDGWLTVERPAGGRRNLYTLHDEAQQVVTGDEHRSSQVTSSRSSQVTSTRNESKENDSKGTKPPADGSPSAPAGGQLDLGACTPSTKGRAAKRAAGPADAVSQTIWEARDPRPTTPYVALRQIVTKLLDAGWTPDEVTAAGKATPALTANAMEFALNQARKPRARPGTRGRQHPDDAAAEFLARNTTRYAGMTRESPNGSR